MSSIVTGILSSTVGLLLNKARDKTAEKLRDGDITDAKIRELIVRELNDVKSKLAALSRKDLLTSYNFLLEGVNLLKASLDKSEEKQKAVFNKPRGDGCETSTKPSQGKSTGILTEALTLSQAMGRVKINSDKEFESAKKRLEDARKKATEAFCNEALSIKDRIFAAKLRIVSELLECLEIPETAITNCLPFLKNLHSLPIIREIFSVHVHRGYKSKFNKPERVENVKSVLFINYVLFRYVLEFSSKYYSPTNWPTIELANRNFRPILDWKEVSTRRSWGEELIQPPNEVILDKEIHPLVSALNGHGEMIDHAYTENINVTSRTGEVKMMKLNYPGDGEAIKRHITGLAVDSDNNVYVLMHLLMYLETRTEGGVEKSYVLYVFDENYNAKQNCTLPFLNAKVSLPADIAINKNNNIIIIMEDDPHVYFCDNSGLLKHKFKRDGSYVRTLTTSDKDEILLASHDRKAVHRYTEKGDLESRIEVPKSHEIRSVAFHYLICKIIVLTFIEKSDSYFLLCYTETGELENTRFLCKGCEDEHYRIVIRSHPGGPAAVVWKRCITFI